MSPLAWLVALASLIGVILNIHGRRACFALWAVTNTYWALVDAGAGLYAQAFLQTVYIALAIYGWWHWAMPLLDPTPDPDKEARP